MMTFKIPFLCCFLLLCQIVCAQELSVSLDEVTISDSQLKHFSGAQSVLVLNDSVIAKNQVSLTALLNHTTGIYFKENGLGMVSSPSFRGTTSQQTAVIWNGINVNSQLNGQTDFNTISGTEFNSVSVRAGGSSILYGSSGIGGAISLNNSAVFGKRLVNIIKSSYGSYQTLSLNYRFQYGTEKLSSQVTLSRNSSDNDYSYPHGGLKNENGEYYNTGLNVNLGYRIDIANYLKFYSRVYDGERHFSLISPSDTKTKYRDFNVWNLLEWQHFAGRFVTRTKVAFLAEQYRYYENIQNDSYTFGKAQTWIGKYDFTFHITNHMALNSIVELVQNSGRISTTSTEKREIASGAVLFRQQLSARFNYELGLKKEITSNYQSPLLFSAGVAYEVAKNHKLKANFSKNFRIPTFNDLYWEGLGNANLKPEQSLQQELGNEIAFKDVTVNITGYHIKIHDMIRWTPSSNGIFRPENTNSVEIYGLEAGLQWRKKIGFHLFDVGVNYAYNQSENTDTGKQLIYVPFHKGTASLAYDFKRWSFTLQHIFTDKVYTQSDNSAGKIVPYYNVTDAGLACHLGKKEHYTLGGGLKNLWNEQYQTVEGRFMPGRNYYIHLTLKF
ncbi:TonB-dependent receptor [Flavobacterium sp. BFFFF1]|uniref:TonB-dependent receptor plug domain-containing protein n=1 Tax=Flavobacterium sp. BFFFF1 TaxID=2015557 RepID=UPI0025BF0DD5|nr:TonB-dependent receptor [Flavobacterium sp. BFFFF1]